MPGQTEGIEYEDERGKWHRELSSGTDRPDTDVEDTRVSTRSSERDLFQSTSAPDQIRGGRFVDHQPDGRPEIVATVRADHEGAIAFDDAVAG